MKSVLPNLLVAATGLAALEIVWVLGHAEGLFLSLGERVLYVFAALGLAALGVLALGGVLWLASSRRWLRVGVALSALAFSGWTAWLLTAGRRVHDLPGRPYAVAGFAVLAALSTYVVLAWRPRRGWVLALPAAQVILLADVLILPRGYPAFHLALTVLALFVVSYVALWAPSWTLPRAPWIALAIVLLGAFSTVRLAAHPTAGFAVREKAPWTARITRLLEPTRHRAQAKSMSTDSARPGVDLRDRDTLLITVDALRADLLGRGVTPELDKLAQESARFTHAYTPAPHTSYALASLLTGKFVKPLIELGQQLGNPQTLPDRLRRYGYRTAAFYPPAIFFVDGASFAALAERGFGFEYRKEQFARADQRVREVDDYLKEADPERPLFVWVHLFEPHEPYDPPADIPHDGSERGRYEAEVRAADRAIAELIVHFRAARPKATVIVTADHGEEFGDHGGSFHGSSLYDEQVRVPLLWSSPGAVAPRTIEAPVELTDVGTTILSTAGVPRDAHMRGDDLGPALLGGPGPKYAFASIDARHMITDGAYKLICGARELHCALFELANDPAELHNLADTARRDALRGELDGFLASITRNEAIAVSEGVGMPSALAQAKLGAKVPLAQLLPTLADARAAVRAEAARVLVQDPEAREPLSRVARFDDDAEVRAEASISAFELGDVELKPSLLTTVASAPLARQRRAALALASAHEEAAVPALAALIADEGASEEPRLHALRALAKLDSQLGVEPAIVALANVRLRDEAARTLGSLGGPRALHALHAQLENERYAPARHAEAAALRALQDPRLIPLIRRYLGMQSSLPHGVKLWSELGAPTSAIEAVKVGSWTCQDGCSPGADAAIKLPRFAGEQRITVWLTVAQPTTLTIDGERFALSPSDTQLSLLRSSTRLPIEANAQVALRALVIVPSVPEIPPPPPEPWDASVPVR
ncbi:MAG TPA: sulfatase-like hydrolase/transferase [Polyangiales bacterium]|nr:sulfatase-like hydrolase/transferase [Polyangiales bacterium]